MSTDLVLDDYEKDILANFEADKFESVLTLARKEEIVRIAEQSFKKDKRINIRLSSRDLSSIQRRAMEEGIPYQTLISSILHKYVSGSLKDIAAK